MGYGRGYMPQRSKYGAKKTVVNGETFDSQREADRWQTLQTLQRKGLISDLHRQVKFEIIQEHREPDTIGPMGGVKKGKIIERARYYVADFTYYRLYMGKKPVFVVEDCKGFRTDVYRLKKALMLDRYGIIIKET